MEKKTYSTELKLKKSVDPRILTSEHIKTTEEAFKNIEKELNITAENFKNAVKAIDMSSVLGDHLLNRTHDNQLISTIKHYEDELEAHKNAMNATVNNRDNNLLIYVHSHRNSA
jgi:hypothetical protein